jgi:hypothetical protein
MTAASVLATRAQTARRTRWLAVARLLRLELRRSAMLWMVPAIIALFWFIVYRKIMAMPPLWNVRAVTLQSNAVITFAIPVAGVAAWMGSREARRRTTDLVSITAWPRWARLLIAWAAVTGWALVAYLACVALVYGRTIQEATLGGPLWWPVAVIAATGPAMAALGFAAGALVPSRFTAPLVAIGAFFALALSTQLITGSQSYWQISPVVAAAWDDGPDPGVATFYHYVPDLHIAQVIFLLGVTVAVLGALALPGDEGRKWRVRPAAAGIATAGLLVAGTAVALAGTGRLDTHGMITIPALHDAASDRPIHYTPVCSRTAIPVCLNPAYTYDLAAITAALAPVLNEIAGLPGAPARISQTTTTYRQESGNGVSIAMVCPTAGRTAPPIRIVLPDQLLGPTMTAGQLTAEVRSGIAPAVVASVTGDGLAASQAQHAVTTALLIAVGGAPRQPLPADGSRRGPPRSADGPLPLLAGCTGTLPVLALTPGSPAYRAAQRFAALPSATRHTWLVDHLTALRAGRISLRQLP